jgi:hypothetical protein
MPLHVVMPTGAWSGRRCFIIGGGPSLRGFDFSRLAGELVIGVNRAFESLDPAVLYSVDTRFLMWLATGKYGSDALHRFSAMHGTKVWCRERLNSGFGGGICVVDSDPSERVDWTLETGLPKHNNSGFGALALAVCLGANPIYLLGFDLKGENGRQAWHHSGHPVVASDDCYARFRAVFERYADEIASMGFRIVNLNPESALRCFGFGTFDDAMAAEPTPERPIVTGYYTVDTGYEAEAREMVASAHRFGLDTDVRPVDNQGDWQRNTQYKARFLRDRVREYEGRTIVYTDADSRFVRYPALFDGPFDGIAFHLRRGRELLSGTLRIGCNEATAALMDLWVEECGRNPDMWDQQALALALQRWSGPRAVLPQEYCHIFDSEHQPPAPVIVHYQASRRLKREVSP